MQSRWLELRNYFARDKKFQEIRTVGKKMHRTLGNKVGSDCNEPGSRVNGFSGAIWQPILEPTCLTKTFDYYLRVVDITTRPLKFAYIKPEGKFALETRFTHV